LWPRGHNSERDERLATPSITTTVTNWRGDTIPLGRSRAL
jgi:hypothetical protein